MMSDETRFAVERELAPHVDPRWSEAVLLELRIQGVDGSRIGAVLAEVDAHCVDSGESALDAFGEPVAYARSLALPVSPAQSHRAVGRVVSSTVVQVAGMYVVLASVVDAFSGEPVRLTLGAVLVLVALVAMTSAFGPLGDRVLRLVLRRPVVAILTGVLVITAVAVLGAVVSAPLAEVPAVPILLAGVCVLAAGTVWGLRETRDGADPIVGPLERADRPGRRARGLSSASAFVVPAGTALLAVVTVLLDGR